jgi:hypothetical protein
MKSSGSLDLPLHEGTEDPDRRPLPRAIAWLRRIARDPTRATRASARTTLRREQFEDRDGAPASAPQPSEQPRYVDICEISRGGMGRIRLVRDTTLLREVAMKLGAGDPATRSPSSSCAGRTSRRS